jgi:hypothetical protein
MPKARDTKSLLLLQAVIPSDRMGVEEPAVAFLSPRVTNAEWIETPLLTKLHP